MCGFSLHCVIDQILLFSMQVSATSSLIVDRFREVAVMSYAEFSSIPVDCVPSRETSPLWVLCHFCFSELNMYGACML